MEFAFSDSLDNNLISVCLNLWLREIIPDVDFTGIIIYIELSL